MTLESDQYTVGVDRAPGGSTLRISVADSSLLAPFEGSTAPAGDRYVLEGPASTANARALQAAILSLSPGFVSAHRTSMGTGDRIGLATAGQARAFARCGQGVFPVFAQQSIREMERLGRDPRDVIDAAVFGAVEAGWDSGFGADCDHIKTVEGIDSGIAAGFTMYTLDPGDYVRDVTGGVDESMAADLPWDSLEDTLADVLRRYEGLRVEAGDFVIEPTADDVLRAVVKYAGAVAETLRLYRHLTTTAPFPVEVEVAVDETQWETTFFEHYYIASELQRLGVEWFSFAPRYVDGFEKALEFRGDIDELRENLSAHHAIGELFGGYKISLHSGSDKFSIYPVATEALDGLVHLKTSGTSYLCALEVIAGQDPELFDAIWGISRAAYARASASYQVSADIDATPPALSGLDRVELLNGSADARQILHVGYGDSLTSTLEDGARVRDRFGSVVLAHHDLYAEILDTHIGRHLTPFSSR